MGHVVVIGRSDLNFKGLLAEDVRTRLFVLDVRQKVTKY
ncbi:hypothetical protein LEP1GSC062_1935 [Leptospira alexanderi serovar Manhao 3 str. L 60]|uniref:Uncharacterized protein n=1 Tax=Leptospira alexanderi serovar Manhao 3 str. L 60 TaxID=1049759 RepID=V6HVG3_9LEPT|nr:hypothetical protein LEP1GSC062_1935 [Leptospira alexanderi serovar Manhao 3 str. L 60]